MGAKYVRFTPNAEKLSNRKKTRMAHFDAKNVNRYCQHYFRLQNATFLLSLSTVKPAVTPKSLFKEARVLMQHPVLDAPVRACNLYLIVPILPPPPKGPVKA